MSIIAFEGFEGLDSGNSALENYNALTAKGFSGNFRPVQTTARYAGGTAGTLSDAAFNREMRRAVPAGITELIAGFAYRFTGSPELRFFTETGGGDEYFALEVSGSNEIEVPSGTPSGIFLQPDVDYYFEVRIKVDDSAGEIDLRINGSERIAKTALDTNVGSVDFIVFSGDDGDILDDIYIVDTTDGVGQTSFLGPVRIDRLPVDGDGDTTNWTPDSANNYLDVDEDLPPDGDTTKVTATAVGQEDQYTLGNISATPDAIYALSIYARHRTDAGQATINTYLSDGTNVSTGSAGTILSTYSTIGDIYESAADGSAWTFNKLASAQAGQKWSA